MIKPWWPKFSVEAMSVGNQLYLGDSTVSFSAFSRSHVIFANKKLLEDYQIEVPYNLVDNGLWTQEKLISMTSGKYVDVNGDSVRDADDMYGWIGSYWANHWAMASGMTVIEKTADVDILRINFDTQKMNNVVERVYSWFFDDEGSYIDFSPIPIFAGGHGIFSEGAIADAVNTLRSSEVTYAILPYPKYDEAQKAYYTYTQGMCFVFPKVESDEEYEGNIIEALAYFRHCDLIPAYYEITAKGKLADSADDARMLDIIYSTMTETFDRCNDAYQGMQIVLNLLIPEKNSDYSSWYSSILPQAEKKLIKLAEFYRDNR